jgi:hypothetical protein
VPGSLSVVTVVRVFDDATYVIGVEVVVEIDKFIVVYFPPK